jgi:hypothetical protein
MLTIDTRENIQKIRVNGNAVIAETEKWKI